jgi:hypothetical protein
MIDLDGVKPYFPKEIRENSIYDKYILKEHIQLMILDFLSTSAYVKALVFTGGTSLRLVKGIDRFSEDLDFDCKRFSDTEFEAMTDDVLLFLRRCGLRAESKDKPNPPLTAFRRNIYFPELLHEMGLSGHKEERFLIKIEAQDQGVCYKPVMANIRRMGFSSRFLLCRRTGRFVL